MSPTRSKSTENLKSKRIPLTPTTTRKESSDQAFTSALYNSLAIIFLIIGVSLCGLLLIVLQAFVRSILWALLTGAFLFSFKHYLTDATCKRLEKIETTSSCLTFQLVILPFQLIDSASDYVWEFCKKKYIQLISIIVTIILLNYVNIFYEPFITYILSIIDLFTAIVQFFVFYVDNSWQISCTILLAYFLSIIFYWNKSTKSLFRVIAIPIWICFLILISQILGTYRMFFLILFFIFTCIGVASHLSQELSKFIEEPSKSTTNIEELGQRDEPPTSTFWLFITSWFYKRPQKNQKNNALYRRGISNTFEFIHQKSRSNRYFTLLFWFYISVKLWSYPVLSLMIFIIIWKLIKILAIFLSNILYEKFDMKNVFKEFRAWFSDRQEVLAPRPFKILLNFYYIGDHKMNKWLRESLHSIISAFMILALLLFLISAMVLLAMEVQDESLKLISIISNVINENMYSQPQLKSLLPEKDKVNEFLQDAINKFYVYGRDWLSNRLKSFISSVDDHKIVEKQLLTQWDMFYSFLSQKASNITTISSDNIHSLNVTLMNVTALPSILAAKTVKTFVKQRSFSGTGHSSGGTIDWKLLLSKESLNYNHLIEIAKENIGVFMSLVDSLYLIIKSNINILFTIVKVSISLLFQSGFALFNFFISFIVYITALFYLLSSSTDQYKPLQWLNEITILKSNYGKLLSKAIEESISSVFVASLKMAAFYGLYTWLIHHIFGLSIAYLPSILASIFGFLPILSTYWVSLPGVLELWLLQDQPFFAIFFLICHILPTYIVDMAIYSDIKGGHPYFTGLAIAGGIYCLGLEGALIGPIVLCLFIVIIKMNKELLSMSEASQK
jgi:predicted PurR-regulated permease PerM